MIIPREHLWIRTNDLSLHVVASGPEDAPLVILLHGFPEFWYGWRYQIDPLVEAGFRVRAVDQRGYNLSDKPPHISDYRMPEMVKDVIGLIDAAGVQKARIVGHDWGGIVAWWVALMHPERVERLATLSAPHPLALQRNLRGNIDQMRKSWYVGTFQIPLLPELTLGVFNREPLAQILQATSRSGAFSAAELKQYRAAWSQPDALGSMINWYRAYIRQPPPAPPQWEVTLPVMILTGDRDTFISQSLFPPSLALCENGQLHTIERASHWLLHEQPTEVTAYLIAWLTR
jgi:pimeloyl-ACP methyl ester carboxylesterase